MNKAPRRSEYAEHFDPSNHSEQIEADAELRVLSHDTITWDEAIEEATRAAFEQGWEEIEGAYTDYLIGCEEDRLNQECELECDWDIDD